MKASIDNVLEGEPRSQDSHDFVNEYDPVAEHLKYLRQQREIQEAIDHDER